MKISRFLEDARAEFEDAIQYFDFQAAGLGDHFIDEVEAAVQRACQFPASGSQVSRRIRKIPVRKFKYNVLYPIEPGEILVIAIAHHNRRPNYWQKRLRA